jgi:hypothetical protein
VGRARCRFSRRGRLRVAQASPVLVAGAITTRTRAGEASNSARSGYWMTCHAVVKTPEWSSWYACATSVSPVGCLAATKCG